MSITVTVQLNQAAIDRLSNSEQSVAVKDAFRRGKKVERKAKTLCPVRTGRLRASIDTEVFTTDEGIGVRVGSNVNYAHWVHDGTRRMPARPFLLDALDAAR